MRKKFFEWLESNKVITCAAAGLFSMLFYEIVKELLYLLTKTETYPATGQREYLAIGIAVFWVSFGVYKIAYKAGQDAFDKED